MKGLLGVCPVQTVQTVGPDGACLLPPWLAITGQEKPMSNLEILELWQELFGEGGLQVAPRSSAVVVVVEAAHLCTVRLGGGYYVTTVQCYVHSREEASTIMTNRSQRCRYTSLFSL